MADKTPCATCLTPTHYKFCSPECAEIGHTDPAVHADQIRVTVTLPGRGVYQPTLADLASAIEQKLPTSIAELRADLTERTEIAYEGITDIATLLLIWADITPCRSFPLTDPKVCQTCHTVPDDPFGECDGNFGAEHTTAANHTNTNQENQ